MTKPTIAIIPGAWHTPHHHRLFIESLNQAGYPTTSKQLPSVGSAEPKKQSLASDADFVRRNIILPELEQGKDVIVITHSYGGYAGDAASKGLSKKERAAAGLSGGVVGIVFMTAFVGTEGKGLLDLASDHKPSSWVRTNEETGQLELVGSSEDIFYNRVNDKSLVDKAITHLKLHSYNSFDSPCPPTAWVDEAFDGRRAYVFCHQDNAIPLSLQKYMVSASEREWIEFELEESDHSPFLSDPPAMVKIVDELAGKWVD